MIPAKLHREAAGVISLKATGDRHSNDLHMTFRSSKKKKKAVVLRLYQHFSVSSLLHSSSLLLSSVKLFFSSGKNCQKDNYYYLFFPSWGIWSNNNENKSSGEQMIFFCTADFVSLSQSSPEISSKAILFQPKETRNTKTGISRIKKWGSIDGITK